MFKKRTHRNSKAAIIEALESRRLLSGGPTVAINYLDTNVDLNADPPQVPHEAPTSNDGTIAWITDVPLHVTGVAAGGQSGTTFPEDGDPSAAIKSEWQWDFGDSTPNSYNQLDGFNAAHIYNTIGTYTLTLTVTDENQNPTTETIYVNVGTVANFDSSSSKYKGTVHVADNDADNRDGSIDNPYNIGDLQNALSDGTIKSDSQILFRSGDEFDLDSSFSQLNISQSNIKISRYDEDIQNPKADPLFVDNDSTGSLGQIFSISSSAVNVVFDHLDFENNYPAQDKNPGTIITSMDAIHTGGSNLTVQNCNFTDLGKGSYMVDGENATDGLFLYDNSSHDASGGGSNNYIDYFLWDSAISDVVMLNNTVTVNTNGTEGVTRVESDISAGTNPQRLLIFGNTMTNSNGKVIRLAMGDYAEVAGNTLNADDAAVWIGANQEGNPQEAPAGSTFSNVIFEDNTCGAAVQIVSGAAQVMLRNNVVTNASTSDDASRSDQNPLLTIAGVNPGRGLADSSIYILNNTGIKERGGSEGYFFQLQAAAMNVYLENNLYVDDLIEVNGTSQHPLDGSPPLTVGPHDAPVDIEGDPTLSSFAAISGNIWPVLPNNSYPPPPIVDAAMLVNNGYNGDQYTETGSAGSFTWNLDQYTYTVDNVKYHFPAGTYDLYIWDETPTEVSNPSIAVPITINIGDDPSSPHTTSVNQKQGMGPSDPWHKLGTFQFEGYIGDGINPDSVTIVNDGSGYDVAADAIRLVNTSTGQEFVVDDDNTSAVISTTGTWQTKGGYLTGTQWNTLAGANDIFSSVALADPLGTPANYSPTSETATASPVPGVFTDFYGNPRPTSGPWTAGAVELNTGPQPLSLSGPALYLQPDGQGNLDVYQSTDKSGTLDVEHLSGISSITVAAPTDHSASFILDLSSLDASDAASFLAGHALTFTGDATWYNRDTINVIGSNGDDSIVADADGLAFDGEAISVTYLEENYIDGGLGNDSIQIDNIPGQSLQGQPITVTGGDGTNTLEYDYAGGTGDPIYLSSTQIKNTWNGPTVYDNSFSMITVDANLIDVTGTTGNDTFILDNTTFTAFGQNFTLNTSDISIDGAGGSDTLEIGGFAARTQFNATVVDASVSSGNLAINGQTVGFSNVPVVDLQGSGENDILGVTGTSGDDSIAAVHQSSGDELNFAVAQSPGLIFEYSNISEVNLYSAGGTDEFLDYGSTTMPISIYVSSGILELGAMGNNIPLDGLEVAANAKAILEVAQSGLEGYDLDLNWLDLGTVGAYGTLDLLDGTLILRQTGSTADQQIFTLLAAAYDNGNWDLPGLTSAYANINSGTAVGWDDDGTQIKIMKTWLGDTNLDGAVDSADSYNWYNGWSAGSTGWQNGDFNYDNVVDRSADITLFQTGQQDYEQSLE